MSTILKSPLIPYPLATKSQEVVPHEIAAPAGCYKIAIQAGASYVIESVPKVPVVVVGCTVPVLAVFQDSLVPPNLATTEVITGAMFCAPGLTTIGQPETAHLVLFNESDEATTVYVQLLHTWNILGTAQQVQRI